MTNLPTGYNFERRRSTIFFPEPIPLVFSGSRRNSEIYAAPPQTTESTYRENLEAGRMMSDFLCIGDYICLYCEETEGYVYNCQSSTSHNVIHINQWQEREKPTGIPNPQAVTFQLCIQNRYKLNKKYRKWLPYNPDEIDIEQKTSIQQAKLAADAENDDNVAEQKRQQGKKVRYGEVVQLRHVFTGKYIHISTTQTSRRDKNNMMIFLQDFNAKHAQFRILPRYKVKSEGEVVQIYDQIILESIKSPGQFFHASDAFRIDNFCTGAELNLGVLPSGYTVIKSYRPTEGQETVVKAGSVLRLFHKELEAYLVAEGLFDDEITEDVHLRIREVDQLVPKTLYPSTSGITYWQIEAEQSILNGEVVKWEQQVRFRHMPTRQYLCITPDLRVSLTPDSRDPNTVFRLHPIMKESDAIHFENYTRIEHVLSGHWLHALKDQQYERRSLLEADGENDMKGLKWDGADLRQISASGEKMYDDAYTLQIVEPQHLRNFNFVAGSVPFLLNFIQEREDGKTLNASKTHSICTALKELKDFMIVGGEAKKERQKLMRNLRIIDLLVKLLKTDLRTAHDQGHLTRVFKEGYDVLYSYMIGRSRKNALYFAKYIDFFQTQISQKGELGLNVAQMIVELIRDNRKIVDRITRQQIDEFITLLSENKNYRYLDLLMVLCVCDGVAIPDNQTYITDQLIRKNRKGIYLTDRGQNINGQPNIIYVSSDDGKNWTALHEFVDKEYYTYDEEKSLFYQHQMDLFINLCYGRCAFAIHVITRETGDLTWDEAFLCLRSNLLPDWIRAKYCEMIIAMFIDVGTNYSVLDHTNLSFVYEDINIFGQNNGEMDFAIKDLVTLFPVLRDWIADFLNENKEMTASKIGTNMLIQQVLRLFHFLLKFGYYAQDEIRIVLKAVINLLCGKNDKPFPQETEKGFSKESQKMVTMYRNKERFEKSPETKAVVDAKYQAMEVLDLLLSLQFNTRLEKFIGKFKHAETTAGEKKKRRSVLCPLLYDVYDATDTASKALKKQKKQLKELREMFDGAAFFETEHVTAILMDLSNYKYDKMVTKSLTLLNKYYSSKMHLFEVASTAQVLNTPDSCNVHREAQKSLPTLRRMTKSKLTVEQVRIVGEILDRLIEFCHLPKDPEERHPMNQNVLINHGVLQVVFEILSQEMDSKLLEQYRGIRDIMKKCLMLLKAIAKGNDAVQMQIFERLDTLLGLQGIESALAIALKEAFKGNQSTCMKISANQVERMVCKVAEHKERAPEFLDLICGIVKVEGLDLTLKRNQGYTMKYVMQYYTKVAYVLDQPRAFRERILTGQMPDHVEYLTNLIDLFSICAEGENRYIESMCQTVMSIEEITWTLNHPDIDRNLKRPYLRFLLYVYMRTAGTIIESGAGDLPHDNNIWQYIATLIYEFNEVTEYISETPAEVVTEQLKKPPLKSGVAEVDNREQEMCHTMHYLIDAVIPFLQTFYGSFYSPDKEVYPKEIELSEALSKALGSACDAMSPFSTNTNYLKTMVVGINAFATVCKVQISIVERVVDNLRSATRIKAKQTSSNQGNMAYYAEELELNAKFRTFSGNCSTLFGGHNTVAAQLKIKSKREYTDLGGDEELPLGEEFQSMLRCFIKPHEKKASKKFEMAEKLINQLAISAQNNKLPESQRRDQEELDIKCLQLLRAMIHNEERKLPEDWEENPSLAFNKRQLMFIRSVQSLLNGRGALIQVLPHLARKNDRIVREVLCFVSIMLFNANAEAQGNLLKYFFSTREEVFFAAIRNRMQLSVVALKERRSLAAQSEARAKELASHTKPLGKRKSSCKPISRKSSLAKEKKLVKAKIKNRAKGVKSGLETLAEGQVLMVNGCNNANDIEMDLINVTVENNVNTSTDVAKVGDKNDIKVKKKPPKPPIPKAPLNTGSKEEEQDDSGEASTYRDDGYIELVLKLLARMCDGQHKGLQDYLREQPDNMKSFDIVAECAQFLNLVYSNINQHTIDLAVQIFNTLNEFTAGNQANRTVILNNKVIDYINFVLRAGQFKDCPMEKVIELRQIIANLLISLLEENSPEALIVAKEVKDTLDKEAVYRTMTYCYQMHQVDDKKKAKTQTLDLKLQEEKRELSKEMKERLYENGFSFFLVLARLYDIDPNMAGDEVVTYINILPEQKQAYEFYKKSSMSIEIIKDDNLQRVNFRVKAKNVLREEVKEKLKWNVDRTSPSNKIRDMMRWSKDILKDIYYQRRIISNPLATFFTKNWLLWNYGAILMSLAINALMLVTWNARASLETITIPENESHPLPPELYDPLPVVALKEYNIVIYAMGGVHNLLSLLVLISYFLSDHPQLPSCDSIRKAFKNCCRRKVADVDEEEKTHVSKLDVHFFSFKTLYYLMFLGLSVAGTVFQGYFFAFHLLNIVTTNQLLKGVIQAVTQNGKSLIWVAILGFIVFYLYALVSFALLRSSFDPKNELYCQTLWQCTVTVIRYGLIGDIFENLISHQSENTFLKFGFLVIFHLSFFIFITTIGLNIIFGIIVDTFSELRDLKWKAESDMRDTCFICSRNSYDFEHHGKGFEHHVRHEHNLWAYIFFFIHLNDTKGSDYTALELHVSKMLRQERYDFFPLNRALTLSNMDEDSTESKLDDVYKCVVAIMDKQREDESKKQREEERVKQLQWREQHRNALQLQMQDSIDTTDSNFTYTALSSQGIRNHRNNKKPLKNRNISLEKQDSLDSHGPLNVPMISKEKPPHSPIMEVDFGKEMAASCASPSYTSDPVSNMTAPHPHIAASETQQEFFRSLEEEEGLQHKDSCTPPSDGQHSDLQRESPITVDLINFGDEDKQPDIHHADTLLRRGSRDSILSDTKSQGTLCGDTPETKHREYTPDSKPGQYTPDLKDREYTQMRSPSPSISSLDHDPPRPVRRRGTVDQPRSISHTPVSQRKSSSRGSPESVSSKPHFSRQSSMADHYSDTPKMQSKEPSLDPSIPESETPRDSRQSSLDSRYPPPPPFDPYDIPPDLPPPPSPHRPIPQHPFSDTPPPPSPPRGPSSTSYPQAPIRPQCSDAAMQTENREDVSCQTDDDLDTETHFPVTMSPSRRVATLKAEERPGSASSV
ncbi:unnamed protein product [Owenia fusiformis]|uniref:Inositol 1,4,5-trisphosphate receptor n=1 Tax=Owenia fusiformis TaxID=6347 RepID=A0A8S4Q492_OWEFU|nr:unnamed protein product [Owenia fusiformis]